MIALYPVTLDTLAQVRDQMNLLAHLGTLGQASVKRAHHVAVIQATPDVELEALRFREALLPVYPEVTVMITASSIPRTMASVSDRNALFVAAARWMAVHHPQQPWVWMDRTCPLRPDWMEALHWEYVGAKREFLGVIENSYMRTAQENQFQVYGFGEATKHMRTGVYPGEFGNNKLFKNPFVYSYQYEAQFYVVPRAAHTPLIGNSWASANFRLEVQDDGREYAVGDQTDEASIRKAVPVDLTGALLLHGCRDGSLERVVLDRYAGEPLSLISECNQDSFPSPERGAKKIAAPKPPKTPKSPKSGTSPRPRNSPGWSSEAPGSLPEPKVPKPEEPASPPTTSRSRRAEVLASLTADQ